MKGLSWNNEVSELPVMNRSLWHCTGGSDQDHSQEKEMQKGKWLSEEALAEKRKDAKSKGEKERYTHLNAEFQRIAMN